MSKCRFYSQVKAWLSVNLMGTINIILKPKNITFGKSTNNNRKTSAYFRFLFLIYEKKMDYKRGRGKEPLLTFEDTNVPTKTRIF